MIVKRVGIISVYVILICLLFFVMAFTGNVISKSYAEVGINATEFYSCPGKAFKVTIKYDSSVTGVTYKFTGCDYLSSTRTSHSGGTDVYSITISKEGDYLIQAKGGSPFVLDYQFTAHIAHNYDDDYTVDIEPTCTSEGSMSIHCKKCSKKIDTTIIPANGHSWEEDFTIDQQPTCTKDGRKSIHCGACDAVKDETVMEMLGHDYIHHEGKAPTCLSNGYDEYDTCSRCSYSTYQSINATGHDFGEWIVVKNETTSENGLRKRSCNKCGKNESEVIEKKSWLTWDIAFRNLFDSRSGNYQRFVYSDRSDISTVSASCTGIAKRITLNKEAIIEIGLFNDRSWYSGMGGYLAFCPGCRCETLTGVSINADGEWVAYICSNKQHNCPYSRTTISKYQSSTVHVAVSKTPFIQDNIVSCSATTDQAASTEVQLNPGTYYLIVYSANKNLTHDILAYANYMETSISVDDLSISYNANACYSGGAVRLKPVVKYLDYVLREGEDYTISYSGNNDIGKAEFVISGKEIFTGTVNRSYNIVPHEWGVPSYSWSKDNSSVKAVRICKNDASHKQIETVKTTSKITKAATYTVKGQTTYTATFKNPAFNTQSKTVANIPKLAKKAQPMTVKATTKTVKVKKLKKKAQTIAPITVKKAQGKVTYKVAGGNAKSKKALKLNIKNGKITVKKKTKKGTYRIKVKVSAAGNTAYKAGNKTVTVTVKAK